jgi:alpha-glucosidase
MKKISVILLQLLFICTYSSANKFLVKSPNEKLLVTVEIGEEITYTVSYNQNKFILPSTLGLEFSNAAFLSHDFEVVEHSTKQIDELWEPVLRTNGTIRDHCNELNLSVREKRFPVRKINLIFRAYDDGLAFRYYIPRQKGEELLQMTDEKTTFRFAKDYEAWMADYLEFNSHQESEFYKKRISDVQHGKVIGVPFVVKINQSLYCALTEANLTDYPGMYIGYDNPQDEKGIQLYSRLCPLKGDKNNLTKASIKTPHFTPWRVIMIGEQPGDMIESDIILNLNDPVAYDDVSWIKPGRCAWDHWWSGGVKMNTETIKKYIDFASEMGFEYQLIDWHWYGPPFTTNGEWKANPDADITTVNPDVDMPHILDYAKQKNVKLWLWLLWNHADKQMDEAFALYEKWGIAGVKIDFMAADHQEMVNWYHKTIQKAAEHHLMLNFHGAYKPTGIRRTYPNMMTREGVLGNEYNGWSTRITPEHNVTLPFTRMLAGQMDYTPGGFLNCSMDDFKTGHPTRIMGTRCHELAKFVIYESPIITVCDHPDHYKNQQGLDFLRQVPAEWDKTEVIAGEIGEYIIMARKNKDRWFIAGMTNSLERTVKFDLGFLEEGKYKLTLWKDLTAVDGDYQEADISKQKVSPEDTISVKMISGGGFTGIIE